jgi:hypothetical protein
MNRDEVMDWIDNANDKELKSPPPEVKAILTLDQECMNYYQVSLNLTQPNQEVDLWNKFQQTLYQRNLFRQAQEKEEQKGLFSTKWLWRLSTAGAAAAIALVLLLFPFSWKQKTEVNTQDIVYSDPIELTLEIVTDFGIDGQYDMGALDYYYAITTF